MKSSKYLTIALAVNLVAILSHAQYTNKPNTYYIEGGGAGGWGSVNYARHFGKQQRYAAHVGFGYFSENTATNKNFNYLTIPFGIKMLWPIRKDSMSFLMAGIGASVFANTKNLFGKNGVSNDPAFALFVPSFGYQRNEENGIFWRISVSGFIGSNTFLPWLGLAIGYRH